MKMAKIRFIVKYLFVGVNLIILPEFLLPLTIFKCIPSGGCHQSSVFKIDAAVHVEFCPMTLLAARGETLCQATIRKSLKCAVNPSEAEYSNSSVIFILAKPLKFIQI